MLRARRWAAGLAERLAQAGNRDRSPGEPRPPVTLQIRQGPDGAQTAVLWVTADVLSSEELTARTVTANDERPMWLDVDTDVMGAAVVPLASVEIRVLDPGRRS